MYLWNLFETAEQQELRSCKLGARAGVVTLPCTTGTTMYDSNAKTLEPCDSSNTQRIIAPRTNREGLRRLPARNCARLAWTPAGPSTGRISATRVEQPSAFVEFRRDLERRAPARFFSTEAGGWVGGRASVAALLAFRAGLTLDPLCVTGNWVNSDPCEGGPFWTGVACEGNRVVSL